MLEEKYTIRIAHQRECIYCDNGKLKANLQIDNEGYIRQLPHTKIVLYEFCKGTGKFISYTIIPCKPLENGLYTTKLL
jgi:hypothetical protein